MGKTENNPPLVRSVIEVPPPGTADDWARLSAAITTRGSSYVTLLPGAWTFATNTEFLLRPISGTGLRRISAAAGAVTISEPMIYVADVSAEAWTPRGSTGLKFWGEMDLTSYPWAAKIATGVAEWRDLNGGSVIEAQATAGKQPTKVAGGAPSGKDCMRFAAASSQFLAATFTLAQPFRVILALKPSYTGARNSFFDGITGTTTVESRGSAVGTMLSYGSGGFTKEYSNATWQVWDMLFNGASSSFAINGGAATTGDVGSTNAGGLTLGIYLDGAQFPSNMDLYGAIVYNNATARALDVAYLMGKAGVV